MALPSHHPYDGLRTVDQVVKRQGRRDFRSRAFRAAGQLEPPLRGLTEQRVIEVVARMTGLSPEVMAGPRKGGSIAFARCLAVYIGRYLGRISTRRMARHLHRDDSSFVRPIARLETRLATDRDLRDLIDRIAREISKTTPAARSTENTAATQNSANQN